MKDNVKGEKGFSLIELLIVIVILAIVTASIFSMLNTALLTSNVTTQYADAQQNLRIAQEYINRDLYNAADNLTGLTPLVTNDFARNYLCRTVSRVPSNSPVLSNPYDYVRAGVILPDDEAGGTAIELPSEPGLTVRAGTDRLTLIRTPDSDFITTDIEAVPVGAGVIGGVTNNGSDEMNTSLSTGVEINGIYLLINGDYSTLEEGSAFVEVTRFVPNQKIEFRNTGSFDLNRSGSERTFRLVANSGNPSFSNKARLRLRKVWIIHYFVDSNNRLIRRVFGQRNPATGLPFTEYVIAENVVNLEFQYILRELDADKNVLPPRMVDEVADGTDNTAKRNRLDAIRQVRVEIATQTARQVLTNQPPITSSIVISPRNTQFRSSKNFY